MGYIFDDGYIGSNSNECCSEVRYAL